MLILAILYLQTELTDKKLLITVIMAELASKKLQEWRADAVDRGGWLAVVDDHEEWRADMMVSPMNCLCHLRMNCQVSRLQHMVVHMVQPIGTAIS
jgi:hypothetical protein